MKTIRVTKGLKTLLAGCRSIEARRERNEARSVRALMRRLREDMPGLLNQARLRERRTAPRFNIFQALGIERREAILHTPFLRHFLDPEAGHGQGFLFLNHFLDTLRRQNALVPSASPPDSNGWQVEAEVPAGSLSIIDLLIECRSLNYVVVIENKIDAAEGKDQIWRYSKWIERNRPNSHRQMVLLTPEGRAPVSHRGTECCRVSYRDDIRKMFEAALPEIKAPDIAACVKQYLSTIKRVAFP